MIRETEISIKQLSRRSDELLSDIQKLADKPVVDAATQQMTVALSEYKTFYDQRPKLDSAKVFTIPKGGENLKIVLAQQLAAAWKNYADTRDLNAYVLKTAADADNRIFKNDEIKWKADKNSFQILYIARRKAGAFTQYDLNLGLKVQLSASDSKNAPAVSTPQPTSGTQTEQEPQ